MGRPWRRLALALGVLALLLAGALAAEPVAAESHGGEDEPHVLLQVENHGSQDREIQVTIDGPEPWSQQVTVPAEGTWEHRHHGEPGDYRVEVVHDDEDSTARGSTNAHTEGCLGPVLAPFELTETGGISVRGGGCEGRIPAFQVLVDDALDARSSDGSDSIDIPLPLDASRGRLLFWQDLAEPDWAEATEVPFGWVANASFHDERGRSLEGTELAYVSPGSIGGRASSGPLFEAEARSEDVQDRLLYASGDPEPVAKTLPVSAASSASPSGASAEIVWQVRYDPQPAFLDCLLRSAQQGSTLPAGASTTSPCPAAQLDAAWWTGEPSSHRGFTTIAQYGVDDPDDPTRIAKLVWAEAIPYPIRADVISIADDGSGGSRLSVNVTNLTRQGQPLADGPVEPRRAGIDRAPLAPLEGPTLRDSDRVPFPLSEASRAAQQDPTLTELQALLEDREAILAGAYLAPDDDTDAGQARTLRWTMAFTAPGEGPVLVECQRPAGEVQGSSLSSPGAECQEVTEAPGPAKHLEQVPAVGTEALASKTATWDAALERWRLLDPSNASAPLTLASYDPLVESAAALAQPRLLVGTPGQEAQAGPAESSQVPTTVSLKLEDGETIAHTTGVKSRQGLSEPSDALSSASAAEPGEGDLAFAGGDPLVGAATAVWLLGLLAPFLFALYSRLTRDEVLEHDTREQIRALVDDEPGLHEREIGRRVEANERTVEHHLRVLVRENVLTALERGGYKHYFLAGEHPPERMQALASLRRGQAEDVYEHVRQAPGVDLTTLADQLDISKPYASKLVGQLVDAGLVDKVREGRSAQLYANDL